MTNTEGRKIPNDCSARTRQCLSPPSPGYGLHSFTVEQRVSFRQGLTTTRDTKAHNQEIQQNDVSDEREMQTTLTASSLKRTLFSGGNAGTETLFLGTTFLRDHREECSVFYSHIAIRGTIYMAYQYEDAQSTRRRTTTKMTAHTTLAGFICCKSRRKANENGPQTGNLSGRFIKNRHRGK